MFCLPQVGVYHRWFRWLTEVVFANRKYVLVNMDETGASHAESAKRGYYVHDDTENIGRTTRKMKSGRTDYTDMMTSLLGVVCSDPTIQPHLPQIVLPKFRGKKEPPDYVKQYYANMGYPLTVMHGTTGWNDDTSMKYFLVELRKVVYAKDPDMWILLVLDNARMHVSRAMLRYIKTLGIVLLIIPARLTWLLQPLDVYVFAEFKRRSRKETTLARLSSEKGHMPVATWIPILGKVTQDVLVRADWQRTFSKCGLCKHLDAVRPRIRDYLKKATNLSPAKPTEEELLDILAYEAPTRNFPAVSWRTLLTGFPQTLLEEPTRRPFRAERLELPANTPPSTILSPTWQAFDATALNALTDAPADAHELLAGAAMPARNTIRTLPPARGDGPAANTRSEALAKAIAALPRARRLPGASASSRGH